MSDNAYIGLYIVGVLFVALVVLLVRHWKEIRRGECEMRPDEDPYAAPEVSKLYSLTAQRAARESKP